MGCHEADALTICQDKAQPKNQSSELTNAESKRFLDTLEAPPEGNPIDLMKDKCSFAGTMFFEV